MWSAGFSDSNVNSGCTYAQEAHNILWTGSPCGSGSSSPTTTATPSVAPTSTSSTSTSPPAATGTGTVPQWSQVSTSLENSHLSMSLGSGIHVSAPSLYLNSNISSDMYTVWWRRLYGPNSVRVSVHMRCNLRLVVAVRIRGLPSDAPLKIVDDPLGQDNIGNEHLDDIAWNLHDSSLL